MHPLLFPLGSPRRWLSFLEAELKWQDQQIVYAKELLSNGRIPIWDGSEISTYLGLSEKLVTFIRLRPPRFYRTFSIPKKSGELRQIKAPRLYLKVIQHYILDCILANASVSNCCFGFRKGTTASDGARLHKGCKYLWNIDLKDFFPTISKEQVEKAFETLGYNKSASVWLGAVCCLENRLPQGAPTSPVLSNLVFRNTDDLIEKVCQSHNITYSRYADDLSFSSSNLIPATLREIIKSLIKEQGYNINPKKERLEGPMCRREVTGLVVNDKVSIPRPKRRALRALFHKVLLNPARFSAERSRLAGIAGWVHQHHPALGESYLNTVRDIPICPPPDTSIHAVQDK